MVERISRRKLLGSFAVPVAAAVTNQVHGTNAQPGPGARVEHLRIDGGRLRGQIEALSVFGRPAGGDFSAGVSRVAYSDADIAGRRYVLDRMREIGLSARI